MVSACFARVFGKALGKKRFGGGDQVVERSQTQQMFLVSIVEKESIIEASLGGRVTPEEIKVFSEEIAEALMIYGPCNILLDYSRALSLDPNCIFELGQLKDHCLDAGAMKIVSVAQSDHEVARHTSNRIQQVLEGREEIVVDGQRAYFAAVQLSIAEAA